MHSKTTINEIKSKRTEKIKLKLKMLVGLQHIYLLDVHLGMSSISSFATLSHFENFKFPFRKTSYWKFLDFKPTHFAARTAVSKENNRSAAEKRGEGYCTL